MRAHHIEGGDDDDDDDVDDGDDDVDNYPNSVISTGARSS